MNISHITPRSKILHYISKSNEKENTVLGTIPGVVSNSYLELREGGVEKDHQPGNEVAIYSDMLCTMVMVPCESTATEKVSFDCSHHRIESIQTQKFENFTNDATSYSTIKKTYLRVLWSFHSPSSVRRTIHL